MAGYRWAKGSSSARAGRSSRHLLSQIEDDRVQGSHHANIVPIALDPGDGFSDVALTNHDSDYLSTEVYYLSGLGKSDHSHEHGGLRPLTSGVSNEFSHLPFRSAPRGSSASSKRLDPNIKAESRLHSLQLCLTIWNAVLRIRSGSPRGCTMSLWNLFAVEYHSRFRSGQPLVAALEAGTQGVLTRFLAAVALIALTTASTDAGGFHCDSPLPGRLPAELFGGWGFQQRRHSRPRGGDVRFEW